MVEKKIAITKAHDEWMQTQLQAGQYVDESDVVRALIREKQSKEHSESSGGSSFLGALKALAYDNQAVLLSGSIAIGFFAVMLHIA